MNLLINLEAFKKGEEKEFEKIVNEFSRKLNNVAKQYLSDNQEAEDIVMEAFTKLYEKRDTIEELKHIPGFLYITVRNVCLTKLRSKKRRNEIEKEYVLSPELYTIEMQLLEDDWMRILITKAIETLPDSMRTICKLHFIENYSISEIEAQLNKSRTNITNQLTKGTQKIKQFLSNNHSI